METGRILSELRPELLAVSDQRSGLDSLSVSVDLLGLILSHLVA